MELPSCLLALCLSAYLVDSSNVGNTRQDISLGTDGGYGDILIAIDDRVTENVEIIEKLQVTFCLRFLATSFSLKLLKL